MFSGVTDMLILFMIIILKKDNVVGSTWLHVLVLKKKQKSALGGLNNIDVFVLQKGRVMGCWRT